MDFGLEATLVADLQRLFGSEIVTGISYAAAHTYIPLKDGRTLIVHVGDDPDDCHAWVQGH